MLHTLSHSFSHVDAEALLRTVSSGDALLFIQDGVAGALVKSPSLEAIIEKGVVVYALREDLEARGLLSRVVGGVIVVDFAGFVDLSVSHRSQMAW
ncbi:protein TusB [Leminorella grimontii]|uniref:Protein TusB n=1 Tax=Leminorella grimontii TaxID=82981 RepID=A0AAV5N1T4_9GAMM|nr:sulfurtransferase complex subunit TusB [Leminorella grimontii]KFC93811.1 TusB family tRNA 5-methylaminomethyl-2-thiouridine synthase [Leminorella grimontii ATCC 33999 = DSM 5078]GKX55490.1 protein TusB [Leminorella grimontii]GKX59300.1 protein TusB [Leminorella grimontii]VFS55712.1 tRNA 2-thiouridine synthesizing protein B [Leminorella grimontii]